jgi:hypothetical protein
MKRYLLLFLFVCFIAFPCGAANEVLTKVDTPQFVFADHGTDYIGGTGNNSLEIAGSTDVQIDVTSLGAGAARQSAKIDLGSVRNASFAVMMSLEMATDPVAGERVDIYWSPSVDSSAAVANAGGCSGADAAYAGYAASTLAEGLTGLTFIGSMILAVMNDADGVPQLEFIAVFAPQDRYGSLVVVNGSVADLFHDDAVEFAVSFNPIVQEIQ